VAQGLAFGANVPVLGVESLLAVAEEARFSALATQPSGAVTALLDARMDEVYSAAYHWPAALADEPGGVLGRWQPAAPLQVGPPERLPVPEGLGVLQAGNVFAAYGERLPAGPRCVAMPTAAALLRLAPAAWAQGQAVPAEQAMPLYIRDKVAHTTAEREALKTQAQAQAWQNAAARQP
jgi:tRNA threonylcarbamoyladenosine biosynthesis protein TsaB